MTPTARHPARHRVPREQKQAAIAALLSGETDVESVCRKLNTQAYQVFAWVGQYVLSRRDTLTTTAGTIPVDPELAKAVGEYFIRKSVAAAPQNGH